MIAIASGKGGVGKTSVAVALARQLARSGRRIGLVDADLYGPDVPRMLDFRRDAPATSVTLARWGRGSGTASLEAMELDGLKVASAGFLMSGSQGLAIGSTFGDMLLSRLVNDTDWGDTEALLLHMARVPVLGGVENMAHLECPHYGGTTELHTPAPQERTVWAQGVPRLVRLPFRPDGAIEGADLAPVLSAVVAYLDA